MPENHAQPQQPFLTACLPLSDGFLTGRTSKKSASTLPPDGLTAPAPLTFPSSPFPIRVIRGQTSSPECTFTTFHVANAAFQIPHSTLPNSALQRPPVG